MIVVMLRNIMIMLQFILHYIIAVSRLCHALSSSYSIASSNVPKRVSEEELCKLDNSADIFNALSDLPGTIDDVEKLLEVCIRL